MSDFVGRLRRLIASAIAAPGTIRQHSEILAELRATLGDLRQEMGFGGPGSLKELRFAARPREQKRCALVLLGDPLRTEYLTLPDVYAYTFKTPAKRQPQLIVETDYLSPELQKTAYLHLAEFSAWYVFYRDNPLQLKPEDFVCFLSSRKFEQIAQISFSDAWRALPLLCEFLENHGDTGAFYPYPERDWSTPDETSFYCPQHFNTGECMRLARESGLRQRFDNYTRIWRNYYFFRYDSFCTFMEWCVSHLVPVLFDSDFRPRMDRIQSLTPAYTQYSPYRIFGLFVEFFHQLYFREQNASQFVVNKWLQVARIDYRDDELNWQLTPLGVVSREVSLARLYRFAMAESTRGKRVVLVASVPDAMLFLARIYFGTRWINAIVDPQLTTGQGELAGIPVYPAAALTELKPDVVIPATQSAAATALLKSCPEAAGRVLSFDHFESSATA